MEEIYENLNAQEEEEDENNFKKDNLEELEKRKKLFPSNHENLKLQNEKRKSSVKGIYETLFQKKDEENENEENISEVSNLKDEEDEEHKLKKINKELFPDSEKPPKIIKRALKVDDCTILKYGIRETPNELDGYKKEIELLKNN